MCGKIHSVVFHEERERTFRYDYNGHSEKNKVYRIICPTAKKSGKQYTLTILPHFLLPGCLVRADDVFTTGMYEDIRGDIEKACQRMGVVDERTARAHLLRFDACLKDFVINLVMMIAQHGEALPDKEPEKEGFAVNINWFRKLTSVIKSIREKLFGFENLSLEDIAAIFHLFIHPAYPCATIPEKSKKNQLSSLFLGTSPDHELNRPP